MGLGYMTVTPAWKAPRHVHDFVELMAVLGGVLTLRLDDRTVEATAGDVLFYAPGLWHQEGVRGNARLEFMFLAYSGGPLTAPLLCHDATGRIRVLFQWIREEQSSAYAGKAESMNAILGAILTEIRRAAVCTGTSLVEQLREHMRDRLADAITVDDLARKAAMSRAHFIRTYHESSGQTPMADLRRLRVEHARELLITTNQPLKAIARASGFCDEFHLSRVFRKQLRVPPGYFRK